MTVLTGALLIALLGAIGVTIERIGELLEVHMFPGMLLIGSLALKLASTGYRFVRYHTVNPRYRSKGPPPAYLRLLGPAPRPANGPQYNSHAAEEAGRIISLLSALVAGLVLALVTEPQFAASVGAHRRMHPR